MQYYIYNSQTKRLTPAPRVIQMPDGSHIANPTTKQYAAVGAYPKADTTPPTPPEGKVAVLDGYNLVGGVWQAQYRYEDAPTPPPRTFSKLRIVAALIAAGVWEQVKAYIEQAGLYDLYLAAQDFAEDNEYFVQGKAALQTALGWTDEQVEAVLSQGVAE